MTSFIFIIEKIQEFLASSQNLYGSFLECKSSRFLFQDEDIKNAIEDAGFEAEILPEPSTSHSKPRGTLIGQFTIGGMTCAACVNSVEGILRKQPGIRKAVVALATSLGEVEYDPTAISKDDIVTAIEDAGFEASFVQSNEQDKLVLGVIGIASEMDIQMLEGNLIILKGLRKFYFDQTSKDLEIHFDPELLSSRTLVDEIESSSYGKLKFRVKNPYTRMASKDLEESSNMFRLFAASLSLSVSYSVLLLASFILTNLVSLVRSCISILSYSNLAYFTNVISYK